MNKKYILVWESGMTEVVKYHPNMFKGLIGPIEGDRKVWKGDGCKFSHETKTEVCCSCNHLTTFANKANPENILAEDI